MPNQLFINLPVTDLEKSKKFYISLGFTLNPQFTDDKAASLIVSDRIFIMLLTHTFFSTFIKTSIADAHTATEVINALSVSSRQEVDEMMYKAITAGAKEYREPMDMEFMYNRAFADLDGHLWEVFFMDPSKMK